MPTVVAFLRAINVGGRFIKMADLASHFRSLGLEGVSTYMNSGNVLFNTRTRNQAKLATSIEKELEPLLGFRSEVFLRSAPEIHTIAATAAGHRARIPASGEVNVAFLPSPLSAQQASALEALRTNMDEFEHSELEVYWLCKGNQMDSRFSNAVMERKLQLRCTFRRVSMLAELSAQLCAAGDAQPFAQHRTLHRRSLRGRL